MIRVRYLRTFDKSYQELSSLDQDAVDAAINGILNYFYAGQRPLGLGIRKHQKGFWVIRASLALRILFLLTKDMATFVVVGTHDQIRRKL